MKEGPAPNSPMLLATDLEVRRGKTIVLDIPRLEVHRGETLSLIGPNGAGKSTLLLTLALLQPPTAGAVQVKGEQATRSNQLQLRRRMAVVFQEPLLLDTSVAENVATGLKLRGIGGGERERRVVRWLESFGVGDLARRPSRSLSGGEAQRVSLARAFALEPEVLFLDEPFSALDAPTRSALAADLRSALRTTHTTTLLVTHLRDEALALGDRVGVMMNGQIRQLGPPEAIFGAPCDEDVAAFVGVENVVPGRVVAQAEGLATVRVQARQVEAVSDCGVGQAVLVCLRPEDVVVALVDDHPTSARNHLPGRVVGITDLGSQVRLTVDCGFPLAALITRRSYQDLSLREGTAVHASFKATALHLISRDQGSSRE